MMHLAGEELDYARLDGYQLVRLPYLSGDFSMVLMVPDEGNFTKFESSLSRYLRMHWRRWESARYPGYALL